MIENVSTQLTVFHCLCPLPASRKGLRLPLRSALFGEGGRDWRPCGICDEGAGLVALILYRGPCVVHIGDAVRLDAAELLMSNVSR